MSAKEGDMTKSIGELRSASAPSDIIKKDGIEQWKQDLAVALDSADLESINTLLNGYSHQSGNELENILKDETWIFVLLCRMAADKIIERLLTIFSLDVNMTHKGMSALQAACQAGHVSVVELLINHGAKPKKTVWDEDSEYYLATVYGHEDVIKVLLATDPDLICDSDITYCLFHAACKGGHSRLVHRWLIPGFDVNRVVSFVPTLDGCELKYPLFAACQGGHYEVAAFLIGDLNARVTEEISSSFPEIACKLVRDLFRTSSHSGEQNFLMSELGIDYVEFTWFEDISSDSDETRRPDSYSNIFETKIDLSKNCLSSIPSKIIWQQASLTELNLSRNPLFELPYPKDNHPLHANSLTSLSLSHCFLKRLNVYIFLLPNLELLDVSHNQLESLYPEEESSISWKCRQLKTLNLSHNCLSSLASFQECASIKCLDVSYNDLISLCSPWQCPLKTLDISHNQISDFPPSCDQFWAESLQSLNASHNALSRVHESMVRMNVLKKLDVSHNAISSMPRGIIWSCPLVLLNLSHNKLGIKHSPSHKAKPPSFIQKNYTPDIELPPSCLSAGLAELFLDHNDLHSLPDGLCYLKSLIVLDINHNPNLSSLPLEMGMLWNLLVLKVEGIRLEDKDMQSMINDLNDPNKKTFQTFDFIIAVEQRRRECRHHDVIKLVVFGCKNTSGQCILQKLIKRGDKSDYKNEHKTFKRDLTFQCWEFPVCEPMSVTHPCFLTENSIYLIVHNAFYDEDKLDKVSQQIAAIQASVSMPYCIIVVCVFLPSKDQKVENIKHILDHKISTVMKCHYVPFIFDDKPSLDLLLATVYSKASQMDNTMLRRSPLVDRKVPKSFIGVVDKIHSNDKQTCSQDELLSDLELAPNDLQDTADRRLRLQEYLLQVGAMLHYNVQMGDLWNLVILDPVWLYDLLDAFMEFLRRGKPKVAMEQVERFAFEKIGPEPFPAFIALLEFFNIGMRIEDKVGTESLLIPSFLPEQPPTVLSSDICYSHSVSRLYCLPAIPSAFWSHVISQLIPAFDRFTNPSLSLPDFVKQKESSDDMKKSFRRGTRKSQLVKGLRVKNKGIQFWSTGIMVWHDQGLVVVEEVQYEPADSDKAVKGVLVTVKTRDDDATSIDSLDSSSKELAAIGVVTDELEEILDLFNPKLMEYMQEYQPVALCPHCHKDIKPGQGIIKDEMNHFQVNICAQRILWEDYVFCGQNLVFLNQIMPEFMFLELPDAFRIRYQDLEFMNEKLGQGMVGSVIKGRFKQTDVAIKSFYTPDHEPVFEREEDPIYPNTGIGDAPSLSMTKQDRNDTELKKIMNAFLDLRREVSVLSKLKHKCIITFLGVCVKRQLLLVLELAPLGSFRSCLMDMKRKSSLPDYKPTVSDPAVVTKSVFGKDLTYKILLQVSSGLAYLHSQSIIFRDLKPDNILVLSLDLEADINVKVTDYGISRFSTSRGVSGLVGTVCYMAPEVVAKQTYTNKVDVYSLGIVMFEAMTGVSPIDLHGTNQQPMVSEIAKACAVPMHVKLFKVSCNFPLLEALMEECWNYLMDDRPSINDVIKKMASDQFLLLHDVLWADAFTQPVQVTCIYSCQTSGRPTLWISESVTDGSLRLLSVYDVMSSMYTVRRKPFRGSNIMAMAKVRDKIWFISEECKEIEVIVRSTQNKFEVKKGVHLDEEPSCLVCHTWKPSKSGEEHAFVLIGHKNGSITTSHVHTQQYKMVTTTTLLELDVSYPVSNVVTVSNDCLMVSAGHTLFQLVIQEQLSGDGLFHPSISLGWSSSLYEMLKVIEHVDKMVADDDSVWCSFDGKHRLVQFDWKEQRVKHNLMVFLNAKSSHVEIISDAYLNDNPPFSPPTSPRSVDSPPRRPARKSTLTDVLMVTSLCKASNLLAVGTDVGGLFLLPVRDISQDDSLLQLPLLYHPDKRKEEKEDDEDTNDVFRLHSDSVVSTRSVASARSVVQNTDKATVDSFSVSNIIQTGSDFKLASVLKPMSDYSVLRKQFTLQRRQARRKREGLVFSSTSDSFSTFGTDTNDEVVNGWAGNNYASASSGNKFSMTNYAEIAIWDCVSDARLNVIKSYRDGFV